MKLLEHVQETEMYFFDTRNNQPDFASRDELTLWLREQKGKQDLLERALVKRFGPLSEYYREFLESGGGSDFDDWLERLMEGKPLEEILCDPDEYEWKD